MDMNDYKLANELNDEKEKRSIGWCGLTNVELGRLIYDGIQPWIKRDDREKIVYTISEILERKRTY